MPEIEGGPVIGRSDRSRGLRPSGATRPGPPRGHRSAIRARVSGAGARSRSGLTAAGVGRVRLLLVPAVAQPFVDPALQVGAPVVVAVDGPGQRDEPGAEIRGVLAAA